MEKALVVIDIQKDITKNYKEVIANINHAIAWAQKEGLYILYIRHENLSAKTRTFKPGTQGAELATDLHVASDYVFTKNKGNVLTCHAFAEFIQTKKITTFYITGADAAACVKSTCYNMRKAGYEVFVLADCITSYDKRKIEEMLKYYESKGCKTITLPEL